MLKWLFEKEGLWRVLPVTGIFIILFSVWYSPVNSDTGRTLPKVGFAAPPFSLLDASDQTLSLQELQGSVVILNFWASWCPPCRAEMPAFQQVYDLHKDEGLVILGVNTTYQDDGESALRFAEERGVQFPVLFDSDGVVSRRYQIQALPTTFFIDRKGIIRQVIYGGPLNEGLLKVEVQKLLGEGN
ncbi:TlpA disulfide reductase family protein [Bellilinea sp.]|jgi:cytochrome c biogenesis protein CcmG/thiol:disulfide interchange protein DsbE|nr:TlpA disulfide reductase family protein [Bellilinea sp.]